MKFNNENSNQQYASKFYYLDSENPTKNNKTIQTIANLIHAGHIVVIPDNTTYIIVCNLFNPDSINALREISNSSVNEPITIYINSPHMAKVLTTGSEKIIDKLVPNIWPGPLALEATPSHYINKTIVGLAKTARFTISSSPIVRDILALTMTPLVSFTAYFDSLYPCTHSDQVYSEFKYYGIDVLLSDKECIYGIPPTIISFSNETLTIKQPGTTSASQIKKHLGYSVEYSSIPFTRYNKYNKLYAIDKKILLLKSISIDNDSNSTYLEVANKFKEYLSNCIIIDFREEYLYLSKIAYGYVDLSSSGSLEETCFNLYNILYQLREYSDKTILINDAFSHRQDLGQSIFYWIDSYSQKKTMYIPDSILDCLREHFLDDNEYSIEEYPIVEDTLTEEMEENYY